jgi:two-component system chemotaxis response regulator CheY
MFSESREALCSAPFDCKNTTMKKAKTALDKAHILIADHDLLMADVLKETLRHMGLSNITHVRSGREAINSLTRKHVDIIITEWEMSPMDGLTLIKSLRKSEDAYFAMMPAIMLTARAEMIDVVEARDIGTTEFLVKPFTLKTLFERLEHIIDFPRDFIVSNAYIGPDRRRIKRNIAIEDRRKIFPIIISEPRKMPSKVSISPHKITPSHSLRKKLGIIEGLSAIITPEILAKAQAQISAFEDEGLKWIQQDSEKIEQSIQAFYKGDHINALNDIKEALLSIKSHSGMFDFMLAANLSFSFYRFMRNKFIIGCDQHLLIARKHMEVLKILLSRQIKGLGEEIEQQLVEGLSLLTEKLQDTESTYETH